MSDSADSDVQQNKRTKRQKSRGPIYTKEENAALVAAVSKEKVTLFCQSVPASEKSAAWERVRDSVNAVSKFHRPTNGVRHRFYDCRATVTKKMQRLRLGQNRGKPIKLREWEAELRDVLLAEDVPGFSSRGHNHRAGDQETSSLEGSAPTPSTSYQQHSGESCIQDPPASASGRTIAPPQDQQYHPERRVQCSPHSPVLLLERLEIQPEITPIIPQTPDFSPGPEEEHRGQGSFIQPPHALMPPTAVPPFPTVQEIILRELIELRCDNRKLQRKVKRLTRLTHQLSRQQTESFEIILARASQQHN
ncbi:uncharacterized protein LOC120939714 [Rana temporaria]|uniref:uncharacterized protein LOC120939714 n=1 Tax=Rana temporaria TaxID=8407 RepID=UPI001AACF6B6|nr:uncharacterized protein LOC120939714 [Rana temporaria]